MYLLTRGIQTDYAVVADGSEFAIVRAQAGSAYFKITTSGATRYTPFTDRPDNASESKNAIIKMTAVIDALEKWAKQYERKSIYTFPGGRVEPKVSIVKIDGGMPRYFGGCREPFESASEPLTCDLYVDVRLAPDASPVKVKHELEALLAGLPFECKTEMYRSQKGHEGKGPEIDYISSIIEQSYQDVFQSKPPPASPAVLSMWTDTNLYWETGIPAAKWGPSYHHKYPDRTRVEIPDLVRAAKVYSLIAVEVCR